MYTQLAIIEASNLMHPLFTKRSTIAAKWGEKKNLNPVKGNIYTMMYCMVKNLRDLKLRVNPIQFFIFNYKIAKIFIYKYLKIEI